jgi:tripartite-type tricarboxylate transporter receptor subunit TctC
MLVPWTAGSQTDVLARMVQPKLADSLGQATIVENRPGAGGTVGAAMVAVATPDGRKRVLIDQKTNAIERLLSGFVEII